jgi:hypothetical protein
VSWLDTLFGRDRPVKSQLDDIFGMSTAGITLEAECGLSPTNGAAICFRPVGSADFSRLEKDIHELLDVSTRDAPLTWKTFKDPYGYEWIVLQTDEVANLVANVHMVSRELQDNLFGEQLLAAVFQFNEESGRHVYWIYNFKRGSFYPFVPAGGQTRDNATELRLSALLKKELSIEDDMAFWYPLWGIPLH